jgi:hypothetical protein
MIFYFLQKKLKIILLLLPLYVNKEDWIIVAFGTLFLKCHFFLIKIPIVIKVIFNGLTPKIPCISLKKLCSF